MRDRATTPRGELMCGERTTAAHREGNTCRGVGGGAATGRRQCATARSGEGKVRMEEGIAGHRARGKREQARASAGATVRLRLVVLPGAPMQVTSSPKLNQRPLPGRSIWRSNSPLCFGCSAISINKHTHRANAAKPQTPSPCTHRGSPSALALAISR